MSDGGETLLDMLVNCEIVPAIRHKGLVLAEERAKGTCTEIEISGLFYMEDLLPGSQPKTSNFQISKFIGVHSICATKDCQLLDGEGQIIELDSYFPAGSMKLRPLEPISVHIDDLLITQDELTTVAQERGLPFDKAMKQMQISVKERESLSEAHVREQANSDYIPAIALKFEQGGVGALKRLISLQ